MCAVQYAGTGAQKTDFTRTGKRTRLGALKDGVNAVTRYYYNNFVDGFRQDAMDLFLGNHVVSRDEGVTIPSVLQPPRNLRVTVVSGTRSDVHAVCTYVQELKPYRQCGL